MRNSAQVRLHYLATVETVSEPIQSRTHGCLAGWPTSSLDTRGQPQKPFSTLDSSIIHITLPLKGPKHTCQLRQEEWCIHITLVFLRNFRGLWQNGFYKPVTNRHVPYVCQYLVIPYDHLLFCFRVFLTVLEKICVRTKRLRRFLHAFSKVIV